MTTQQNEGSRELALVDDDEEFRSLARRVAEPLGWHVFEFTNGSELMAAIGESSRPGLIVLDIVMPKFDGIETVSAIGAISVRCPIVLVTGRLPLYTKWANELGQAHGLEIVDVLQKPVPLERLRAALGPERVIGGK